MFPYLSRTAPAITLYSSTCKATSRVTSIWSRTCAAVESRSSRRGELFDYVNGSCQSAQCLWSGQLWLEVTHRFVLAGTFYVPGGFELTTITQVESARPFTLTTPVDVNGFGDSANNRAVINGRQTTLDQFRGTPYIQADLRVSRPFKFQERWSVIPVVEYFDILFNRNNPGANYGYRA